jgi:hypothetical protein
MKGLDTVERVALWLRMCDTLSAEDKEAVLVDLQDIAEQRLEAMCKRLGVTLRGLPDDEIFRTVRRLAHSTRATPSERAAHSLMTWCISARIDPEGLDELARMKIVAAYAGLSDDLVEFAKPFKARADRTRKPGPVRAWLRKYMAKHPEATAAQAWAALAKRPPKGMTVRDNRVGKYIETAGHPDTSYRQFQNLVSLERSKK